MIIPLFLTLYLSAFTKHQMDCFRCAVYIDSHSCHRRQLLDGLAPNGATWRSRHGTEQRRSPKALLDAATFPTLQSLESRWKTVEHDQTQFIEALTPRRRLSEELAYINQKGQRYSYPLWQQLVHVVNHSSYHRGQITTLLRQLGAEAVSTDFLLYYDEKLERA